MGLSSITLDRHWTTSGKTCLAGSACRRSPSWSTNVRGSARRLTTRMKNSSIAIVVAALLLVACTQDAKRSVNAVSCESLDAQAIVHASEKRLEDAAAAFDQAIAS